MIFNIIAWIQNCFNIVLDKKNGLFNPCNLDLIIDKLMIDLSTVDKHN